MTTTITARVDSEKKRQAEEIFNDIGMTLFGAINVFINKVVMYQGIPFSLRRRPAASRSLEAIMDETDEYCRSHSERLSHAQVFGHAREIINAGRRVHA
ncbi:MAG: type II toxin-antitoxin system RelB/DinJ family antitoxin [Kiritimatiellae bacterium]|nr:type II toxin-antitoxin system RelB/DinJ family antitoxin [Kiritimatiellia bacterium]